MNLATIQRLQRYAQEAVDQLDIDELDPDDLVSLCIDDAHDFAEVNGPGAIRIYVEAFTGAALERLGL